MIPENASIALRNGMNLSVHLIECGRFEDAADMLARCVKKLRSLARAKSKPKFPAITPEQPRKDQ